MRRDAQAVGMEEDGGAVACSHDVYTAVALSFDKLPPQRRMMMATGIKLASSSYATQLSVQICLVFLALQSLA